jgi:ABC-2 type transport system permease protein
MKTTYTLTIAALKMFIRSRQALFFTLFMPMVIMVIFGLVGFDKAPVFDVGLVAGHPQPATQKLVDQLKGFAIFKIHEGTLTDELAALKNGDRAVVLDVPDDFITVGAPAQPKQLTVYANEAQQSQSQTIVSVLDQYLDKTSLVLANAPTYFSIKQEIIDSKHLTYVDFLLPGLIAMSVMQMSVFSVAFVFVQYKEKGVLKRLLATPMWPGQFVAANVITRMLVSVVQTAIFIAAGILFMHAHVIGSYALVLLCVVLGALMFLGLGFTISGVSKTVDSVPAFANLIVFPMLFLGGTFFPISGMPSWLQTFAKFLPLTFFSGALRDVMTKAAGFGAIAGDLVGMLVWAIVLIAIATYTFSFQEKESA